MRLLTKLKDLVGAWRSADPYEYECTVCDSTFHSQRSSCPSCGGDVRRTTATDTPASADPQH